MHRPFDIRNRPRIPIPDEDDPYAVATDLDVSSGSSGFGNGIYGLLSREQVNMQSQYPKLRRDKPPKLPPRDKMLYGHHEVPGAMKVRNQIFAKTVFGFVIKTRMLKKGKIRFSFYHSLF